MSYTNEFLWELLHESFFLLINVPLKQKKRVFVIGLWASTIKWLFLKRSKVETSSEFSSLAKGLRVVRRRVCNSKKLQKSNFALMTLLTPSTSWNVPIIPLIGSAMNKTCFCAFVTFFLSVRTLICILNEFWNQLS